MNSSVQQAIDLVKELYHVNICPLETDEHILQFTEHYHFHSAQNAITYENISKLIHEFPVQTIYLTDALTINYIIFYLKNTPVLMGPFCSMLLSSQDARTIIYRNHINDMTIQEYFSYYNSYPILNENQALHIVDSLHNIINHEVIYNVRKITGFTIHSIDDTTDDAKRNHELELLEKRYSYEQRFISDIEHGNANRAILNLHNMQADVQYLKRIGTTLENEKIGAAITRTTARLAAMNAGLPIFLIDQISRNNTIITSHAGSIDEILQAKESMIREFCNAIRDHKNNQYNAVIQSILYYFEHNYYKNINLLELSEELGLSKNYIISEFKKATGITPIAYLRNIRLKHASILLSGTNLSVQEVAEAVGIIDSNYFIKLFKKEYGVTPYLYKKRLC